MHRVSGGCPESGRTDKPTFADAAHAWSCHNAAGAPAVLNMSSAHEVALAMVEAGTNIGGGLVVWLIDMSGKESNRLIEEEEEEKGEEEEEEGGRKRRRRGRKRGI